MIKLKINIKKTICIAVVTVLLACSTSALAAANVILINGNPAEIPAGMGKICETDNRTFVPLRFVSEFLNNTVQFDDVTKTAFVGSEDKILLVQSGNNLLYIVSNATGETTALQMDTAAFIDDAEGRTYVPVRFLAEALGYTVGWDEARQTVSLDKK